MILEGNEKTARYFDVTLKKLINIIFKNLEPGKHIIAIFDTVSNLIGDKFAR